MKVIDLLNKIANNEEVPKFWWNGCIHQIEKSYDGKYSIFDTCCKKYKRVELNELNDEIEIIEEKPEKLTHLDFADKVAVGNKINEIIDYLLEKESDK